jgi:hypothetical protein
MGKLRAIIVADIEVKDLDAAREHEKKLQALAKEIEKWGPPDGVEDGEEISVEQVQAKITLQERRGATGPIEQIIFRGTRGPYNVRKLTRGVRTAKM